MPNVILPEDEYNNYSTPLKKLSIIDPTLRSSIGYIKSSLELRRRPQNELLVPSVEFSHDFPMDIHDVTGDGDNDDIGCFRVLCLNSRFSLRKQMMLTFGTIYVVTILLIMAFCVIVSITSGDSIKYVSYNNFERITTQHEGRLSRFLAETLAPKLIPKDLVQLIYEAAQDRFMGYPDHPGYIEDVLVPFYDIESKSNRYPIVGDSLRLDWQIYDANVNDQNYLEHVQNRWGWYESDPSLSTATGSYYMQGMCDPSVTDPSSHTYYPNCTKENNNIITGGVIAPTPTNFHIHRKASDLAPLFKALYEYHHEVRSLGIYFVNGGSGSSFQFPHHELNTNIYYESIGCDWLLNSPHPYNESRPIIADAATRKQIQYNSICRTAGTRVSSRVYNPLERDFCRDQALHPNQVRVAGPYVNAFYDNLISIIVGRAIYDRFTNEFVGCIGVHFVFDSLDEILRDSRLTDNAEITVVRFDEHGTVVASSGWDQTSVTSTITIDAIQSGGSKDIYQDLYSLVDYDNYTANGNSSDGKIKWNATLISETYESIIYDDMENGFYISGYPIPPPPKEYDPNYKPDFMAIIALPKKESLKDIDAVISDYNLNLNELVTYSVIVGSIGLVFVLFIIILVSHYLTSPLQYMNDVATDIFQKKEFGYDSYSINKKSLRRRGSNDSNDASRRGSNDNPSAIRRGSNDSNNDGLTTRRRDRRGSNDSRSSSRRPSNDTDSVFSLNLSAPMNVHRTSTYNESVYSDERTNERWSEDRHDVSGRDVSGIDLSGRSDFNFDMDRKINTLRTFEQSKCAPKTEISEVVKQFHDMLSQFTGTSIAKSMKGNLKENKNGLVITKGLEELYASRAKESEFKYVYKFDGPSKSSASRFHKGTNIKDPDKKSKKRKEKSEKQQEKSIVDVSSPESVVVKRKGGLFFWIVVLMVLPFFLIALIMSGVVAQKAVAQFDESITLIKESFVRMERDALKIYTRHRAQLVSSLLIGPIRDTYVLTRHANWLLGNGVKRAKSFPEMVSHIEDCKNYSDPRQCEHVIQDRVCDCAWDDHRGTCLHHPPIDARYSQKLFYTSPSHDTWPNGDRNSTSFPEVDYSANSTAWFTNVNSLPGAEEGYLATGHKTTYSRVRALSALPIVQALYNKEGNNRVHLASYWGFESDGTYMGYEGCAYPGHASRSSYVASELNAKLRPEICPVGKYGYDPRCRSWYDAGKRLYETQNTHIFVTAAYAFAGENAFGQSITSPLLDSVTGEYLGQVIVDFLITEIFDFLTGAKTPLHKDGFPIIITAATDIIKDTMVGPGFDITNPQPIADVVFANDPDCEKQKDCERRQEFQDIVAKMKKGIEGTATFTRATKDGTNESFYMAHHPITARSISALDSSDFSRGVNTSEHVIYSFALVEPEISISRLSNELEKALEMQMLIGLWCLLTIIGVATTCVIFISYRLALSITEPMHYLLEVIGQINQLDSYGNAPEMDFQRRGRSREVVHVFHTMESLYNVVRSANSAFFDGDLTEAYFVLTRVLNIYRELDNKKGMNIACNNLGNVMLAMFRTLQETGEDKICGFSKADIVAKGIAYFHETISLCETAYDAFYEQQGWSPICLEFMQHLSNRYFNRGLFLLTVKDCHESSKEIEGLALRDLEIARDMDLEIVEEGSQAGWGVRTVENLFDVTVSRLRGHILLHEMGYEDEWDIEERLNDAFKTVNNELLKKKHSALFKAVTPVGRMQQVETELMRFKMAKGDIATAAKIAVRMLVEDEFVLADAQLLAVDVLISYFNSPEVQAKGGSDSNTIENTNASLSRYRDFLLNNMNMTPNANNVPTRLSEDKLHNKPGRISVNADMMGSYSNLNHASIKASSRGDFTMEMF